MYAARILVLLCRHVLSSLSRKAELGRKAKTSFDFFIVGDLSINLYKLLI